MGMESSKGTEPPPFCVDKPFWELMNKSRSHFLPQVCLTASALYLFFGVVTTQQKMRSLLVTSAALLTRERFLELAAFITTWESFMLVKCGTNARKSPKRVPNQNCFLNSTYTIARFHVHQRDTTDTWSYAWSLTKLAVGWTEWSYCTAR